jgi:hypothetical protein
MRRAARQGTSKPMRLAESQGGTRRALRRAAVAALLAVCTLAGLVAPAGAAPPPPAELQVEGGEERWHSKRRFRVLWKNPAPSEGAAAVAAVHYRVRDPAGAVAIGPTRIGWPATSIEGIEVPGPPGAYTLEAWLEDAAGETGPSAAAKLRFDDERPGMVEPVATATWIGRAAFPFTLRLGPPAGAPPVSGIRGYAVSVAPPPGRSPCQSSQRCSESETDLRGGVGDDSYRIADLPEGTSYVQAVSVSGSGMASPQPGRAVLRVDETSPAVRLGGLPQDWVNHPVSLIATAADEGSGMAPAAGGVDPFTAIAIDGGTPIVAPGAAASASVIEEGVHEVACYARDLAGNVDDGGGTNGLANAAPPIALVRIDMRAPTVSFLNSQDPADPESIRARIDDSMSGPDPARGWIGVRIAGSGDRFAPLPEAAPVRGGELRARWDSDAYPAGEYEFRAVGHDAAGNAAATTRRADGKPMLLSNPLKAATSLRVGLGDRSAPRRAVSYGRGSLFKGRLTTTAGSPLGAMPVRIVERFQGRGGTAVRVSPVTTGPGGAFAIRLDPGPSREVTALFAGMPTLTRSSSPALKLAVRSAVELRASSPLARVGGRPVVFRGRVAAAPATIPADGKSVQLQFRLPGLPWSEFRTVKTDRNGRFRYAYGFSDDDSRGVRFQFRAFAPAQVSWPYEPNGSRPVTVRGI